MGGRYYSVAVFDAENSTGCIVKEHLTREQAEAFADGVNFAANRISGCGMRAEFGILHTRAIFVAHGKQARSLRNMRLVLAS